MDIFAEIMPKPEFFNDAESAILSIVDQTPNEKGCLRFEVYASENRSELFLVERWADKAAFDFHHAQPYVTEIFEKYQNWLAHDPRIVAMSPVQENLN